MLAKILVGGYRYDTTGLNEDKDIIIIEEGDNLKLRCFKEDENDYIVYSEKYINEILKGNHLQGSEYVLLALCNQKEYPVNFSLYNEENYSLIFRQYFNWVRALIKIRSKASKLLMYPFVLMFYKTNGQYLLTNEQQNCVNQVHRLFKIEDKFITQFIQFYDLNKEEAELFRDRMQSRPIMTTEALLEKRNELLERKKINLRMKRKKILAGFDIYKSNINYGLGIETEEEHREINKWYQDLLDLEVSALENIPEKIKYYMEEKR